MNYPKLNWKTAGLLVCALALSATLQAQTSSTAVALVATDPSALVGTTSGAFTLIRYGDTNSDLAVNVDVSGTASNGVDYVQLNSVFVVPAGFYALDITVQPLVDTVNRGNKTVVLTLQTNGTYRVRGNPKATVKIVDDIFDLSPPTVSLTSPGDGSVFTSPASITLQADVSDPDLPIQSVSFYADDALLGRMTNGPYTFVWDHPHNGHHSLFVRAVSEFGKSTLSTPVDITVSDAPVVTLSSPAGVTVFIGEAIPLVAQIGDPAEAIRSVSFYMGSKLLGTVTQAPFVFNWQTTALGTFSFQAIAVDANTGKKGDSSKLSILVTGNLGN